MDGCFDRKTHTRRQPPPFPFPLLPSYTTPTRVKLILVAADPQPRDDALRSAFAALHAAFVDAACNPFYSPGDELPAGGSFGRAVREAVAAL